MTVSNIIYLGTPYMDDNPVVMDFRAEVSDIISASLAMEGYNVFPPISAWHHIAKKYDMPRDWSFWYKFDEEFIKVSNELRIIMLYGWKKSTGVTAEKELAIKHGLEISYIDPTPYVDKIRETGVYDDHITDIHGLYDPMSLKEAHANIVY